MPWEAAMKTLPLVSVVIPCYNAERWVNEAVDSCLNQTYPHIEVVVIDDGSTDGSIEALRRYGDAIHLEQQPNRGSNAARNRGVALSTGTYIQFLDADDYLQPDKIERQVQFLEQHNVDGIYGDWRYLRHHPDGSATFSDLVTPGEQDDLLDTLLSNWDWWCHPSVFLWRREAVIRAGGWDADMHFVQDRDFLLSVALSGSKVRYLPGYVSVYRRSNGPSVTSNQLRWLQHRALVLEKAERKLRQSGRLTERYRRGMAAAYFRFARALRASDPAEYQRLLQKTLELDPNFKLDGRPIFNLLHSLVGLPAADRVAWYGRQLLSRGMGRA
jgi:glycosyltransferase involved in cell wall biosynthesis